ncbi:MAG: sulfotransferase [Chloroflexi bacterium]|nr:sulfotransferase [Chloroflexota bacterium]
MSDHSPILVTGAHRSGTTWVGRMLAAGGEAAYISEPLNVWHRPGVMRAPVSRWYGYICAENASEYLSAFQETLALRYHLGREFVSLRSFKDVLRMGRDGFAFWRGRLLRQRPLLKDPFAVFSAPWFAGQFGSQVVITVRHPAAFVSSLKRLGWSFDFRDLLEQPLLMRDCLEPFRAEMEAAEDDVISQGSLLWRMIYHVVDKYRRAHPDFRVVRHEDLSVEPVAGFGSLYETLGLEFNARARRAVEESSSAANPKELSRTHAVRLDSRANVKNWRRRLTDDEIARVRQMTADVAEKFYADDDWK